ncbi:MAG: Trk system potassium transporter TrkA [Saprospiraceae bacterium]
MRIIIAGAGRMGFHLAELLALENNDIILIDQNQQVLDYVRTQLDVLTIKGDAASFEILEKVQVADSQLFIAATTSEKTNLVAAMLAKKMGTKQTIARLEHTDHLTDGQHLILEELGIDASISPKQLAAEEIHRLVQSCSFSEIYPFEDGKMSIVGVILERSSRLINRTLEDIAENDRLDDFLIIALQRSHRTIIPNGNTILRKGDKVYFMTKASGTEKIEASVGCQRMEVNKVMIIGGTGLGYETAKLLENDYQVTLVESDRQRCLEMATTLSNTLVINGVENDFKLLETEGLAQMDVFITATDNEETNIITGLLAKEKGAKKTIALVENRNYIPISHEIGVDSLINKKLIAANEVFRYVRKGKVAAVTNLQSIDAEIIVYELTKNNVLTRKPIKKLRLPDAVIIGGIIRAEETYIPNGDFQMQQGDKVIVFTLPHSISQVEKIFK